MATIWVGAAGVLIAPPSVRLERTATAYEPWSACVPGQGTDTVANGCVRRYLHRGTASLYARLPKCANNAIALMLFAQYGGRKLSVDELRETVKPEKKWGNLNRQAFTQDNSGLVALRGDTYQLPPASTDSFKPVIVRNPSPHPALCLRTAKPRANANRSYEPPNRS
jgi:hypothetical protein